MIQGFPCKTLDLSGVIGDRPMRATVRAQALALVSILALACMVFGSPASAGAAELEIVGTGDGIDLLRALGNDFAEENGSIRIDVPPSIGSGGAIAAVAAGKATIGRVARKLTASEVASGLVYRAIAILPCAFFVHPWGGMNGLTAAQIRVSYAWRITY